MNSKSKNLDSDHLWCAVTSISQFSAKVRTTNAMNEKTLLSTMPCAMQLRINKVATKLK